MSQQEMNSPQPATAPRDLAMQGKPWHVLRVRSNFEKNVALHLTVRSVENYVPLYRQRVKWTDRTVITDRPLFCGYVFARFFPEFRIRVISTPGVVRSLSDHESNMVSSEEIERIREGLSSGLSLRPNPKVSAGTRVRVRSGIFEGVEGVVKELHQECKVILTLAAIQQAFSLEVQLTDLEILNEKPPIRASLQQQTAFGYGR